MSTTTKRSQKFGHLKEGDEIAIDEGNGRIRIHTVRYASQRDGIFRVHGIRYSDFTFATGKEKKNQFNSGQRFAIIATQEQIAEARMAEEHADLVRRMRGRDNWAKLSLEQLRTIAGWLDSEPTP